MPNELTPREDKLLETLRSTERSREELLALAEEARREHRDDFEIGILEILDERFPDFSENAAPKTENSRRTSATFAGKTRHFDSAKDAYCWLIASMLGTMGIRCGRSQPPRDCPGNHRLADHGRGDSPSGETGRIDLSAAVWPV